MKSEVLQFNEIISVLDRDYTYDRRFHCADVLCSYNGKDGEYRVAFRFKKSTIADSFINAFQPPLYLTKSMKSILFTTIFESYDQIKDFLSDNTLSVKSNS